MTTARLRLKPSSKAHDLVRVLDVQCRVEGMSRRELAQRSGVPERTLADWWYGKGDPHVSLIEAALGVFDLRLKAGANGKS